MHESVYQRIKNEGKLSWNKSSSFEEMWQHETNTYLQKNLKLLNMPFKGLKILDLGTGTGTSALFSSKEGAVVVGVEYSETAISIAIENAQKLKLNVEFIQGDILSLDLGQKFNIVIDSTVLHCIVGIIDRQKFYETAKKHLVPGGLLFINTMISKGDMSNHFPAEYFCLQDNILWSLGINEISERKTINGKSYFPHRTLLSEEMQLREFTENGFEVINMEITSGDGVSCMVGLIRYR